jgi:uncharacterized repeat protein (TIGR03803 family)
MRLQDLHPVRSILVIFAVVLWVSAGWAGTEKVLFSFTNSAEGSDPEAGLIFDKAGNLYGTTVYGGADNSGTVFELSPSANGWQETILHSFRRGGKDGSVPYASLVMDGAGNLYGTTSAGGGHQNECGGEFTGCGTVFELSPTKGGWRETILYNFPNFKDGKYPASALALDSAGNLYGTTYYGGINTCAGGVGRCGVVFKVSHGSRGWHESVIYNFCSLSNCADGSNPDGPVILDRSGNLYGEALLGGDPSCNDGCGTVFRLTPSKSGWKADVIYSFTGQTDGEEPFAGLVLDRAGNLYGKNGGSVEAPGGSIFELKHSKAGWQLTTLHNFDFGKGGDVPNGPLTLDKAGNIYGTTGYGGSGMGVNGNGVVFKLVPFRGDRWKEKLLYTFPADCSSGCNSSAGVIRDGRGNVYGTSGLAGSYGAVFEVIP